MHRQHTLKSLKTIAKKYTGRREFSLKDPGAYKTACRKGVLDSICQHMIKTYPVKHSSEYLLAELKKYKRLSELREQAPRMYQHLWKRFGKEIFDGIRRAK